MKHLISGLGSIGQRHLQNIRALYPNDEIIAYRTNNSNLEELDQKYGIKSYTNLEDALKEKPDTVFVTNPTSLHMPISLRAAQEGCHLFIEKPISHNLDGVEALYSILEKNDKVGFLAFNFRYHPHLIKIKETLDRGIIGKPLFGRIEVGQYLPDWHPGEDYRLGYAARKDLGGGITLTLIHEIDYANWLFNGIESVMADSRKLSSLEMDVEDTTSALMRSKDGALIELHLDCIQRPLKRTCEITGENGKIIWNYATNTLDIYSGAGRLTDIKPRYQRNEMYQAELLNFINSINGKEIPKVQKEEVIHVMKVVDAIKQSSKEGRRIEIK
nr:hypothetical protein [Nanoarchaeum sp.]